MKVGDRVVLTARYTKGIWTISRETKTLWILRNGHRFYKETLRMVGEHSTKIEECTKEWDEFFIKRRQILAIKIKLSDLLLNIPTLESKTSDDIDFINDSLASLSVIFETKGE